MNVNNNNKEVIEEEEIYECTKVIGNEIFFYGDVTPDTILEFIEKFKKLEIGLLKASADLGFTPEIRVHIMSDGGDLFSGFSAMNLLEKSRVRVVTIAQGACCSAATFILLGGQERRIARNAYLLIHQLSTGAFWGKFEEIKDEYKSVNKFMDMIRSTYLKKTKIPQKKLENMMKRDIYLDSKKCLKYAIVHAFD